MNMNIKCTFAWVVVGATHDKKHNSFSARGSQKVAHHWSTKIRVNITKLKVQVLNIFTNIQIVD